MVQVRGQPALDTLPILYHISCMVEQEKKWGLFESRSQRRENEPNTFTPGVLKEEGGREAAGTHLFRDWDSSHCWRGSCCPVLRGLLLA